MEHAAQCLAIETLRSLMAMGITAQRLKTLGLVLKYNMAGVNPKFIEGKVVNDPTDPKVGAVIVAIYNLVVSRGRTVVPTETGRQLHGITTRLFGLQDEARALLAEAVADQ